MYKHIGSYVIDCAVGSKFESSVFDGFISRTLTIMAMQCMRLLGECPIFSNCNYYEHRLLLNIAFAANNVPRTVSTVSNVRRHITSFSMLPETHRMLYKTCRYNNIRTTDYVFLITINSYNQLLLA